MILNEEYLDEDGYPADETLGIIEQWQPNKQPLRKFLDFLKSIWWNNEWGYKQKGKRVITLELHTGGWSGNEDIVMALQNNLYFWCSWEKSYKGGHYYFKFKAKMYDLDKNN